IKISGDILPGEDMLKALELTLPFEEEVMRKVYGLSKRRRLKVFELFDIDREGALNLVSFTEMMLSLFQETDSTIDGSVLAFYQQREWRLIHHMRLGMIWYCLGQQPEFRDRQRRSRPLHIAQLRRTVEILSGETRTEEYFKHCWLLEKVDGMPIRQLIS